MKLSMDLEKALDAARDALGADMAVEVFPSMETPGEYRVRAGGIDVAHTETRSEEAPQNYGFMWGRDDHGTWFANFIGVGFRVGYKNEDRAPTPGELQFYERNFCAENKIECLKLSEGAEWDAPPGGPYPFYKVRTAPHPDDRPAWVVRTCHFGCGRVLRDHERHCPDCVPSYDNLYNSAGGF